MTRYVTRRAWWQHLPDDPMPAPALSVLPDQPVNTGLVDARGTPIWRMPEPVGFPIVKREG